MVKSILRDDIEYAIHCESNGKIIGPISKIHAHLPGPRAALTHYSTWSMVFNPKTRKYGIQLKNPNKADKLSAGKWDMGVAGHNCYIKKNGFYVPLDFDENLIKECDEEIGLTLKMYKIRPDFIQAFKKQKTEAMGFIFDKFHYKTELNNEWVGLGLIVTTKIDLKFKDKEVVDFKWFTPNELKDYLKKNNNYCSPLPLVFEKAEKFRTTYLS
jgi:isopentenyldiphosphate isomerase